MARVDVMMTAGDASRVGGKAFRPGRAPSRPNISPGTSAFRHNFKAHSHKNSPFALGGVLFFLY
jgi:hypothetical protein